MKSILFAAALIGAGATAAVAAPEKYVLDSSHSQIVFSYNHLGYSTTWGMFSGFAGEVMFDQGQPGCVFGFGLHARAVDADRLGRALQPFHVQGLLWRG